MLLLSWRLIYAWICLASVLPIRLEIIRTGAIVAFAVRGTARVIPFLKLCSHIAGYFPEQCSRCYFVSAVFIVDHLAIVIDSLRRLDVCGPRASDLACPSSITTLGDFLVVRGPSQALSTVCLAST